MRSFLSLIVFTALASPATAHTDSECYKKESSAERLACYDNENKQTDLKKNKPSPPKSILKGKWHVREERSKLDDSKSVFLSLAADEFKSCPFKQANHRITIRCLENTTSVIIGFGGCFMSDLQGRGRVTFRADKEKSFTRNLLESTSHETLGLWSGSKAIPFIKSILDNEKLYLRATPFKQSPVDATYHIAGLAEAIKPLRKACGW